MSQEEVAEFWKEQAREDRAKHIAEGQTWLDGALQKRAEEEAYAANSASTLTSALDEAKKVAVDTAADWSGVAKADTLQRVEDWKAMTKWKDLADAAWAKAEGIKMDANSQAAASEAAIRMGAWNSIALLQENSSTSMEQPAMSMQAAQQQAGLDTSYGSGWSSVGSQQTSSGGALAYPNSQQLSATGSQQTPSAPSMVMAPTTQGNQRQALPPTASNPSALVEAVFSAFQQGKFIGDQCRATAAGLFTTDAVMDFRGPSDTDYFRQYSPGIAGVCEYYAKAAGYALHNLEAKMYTKGARVVHILSYVPAFSGTGAKQASGRIVQYNLMRFNPDNTKIAGIEALFDKPSLYDELKYAGTRPLKTPQMDTVAAVFTAFGAGKLMKGSCHPHAAQFFTLNAVIDLRGEQENEFFRKYPPGLDGVCEYYGKCYDYAMHNLTASMYARGEEVVLVLNYIPGMIGTGKQQMTLDPVRQFNVISFDASKSKCTGFDVFRDTQSDDGDFTDVDPGHGSSLASAVQPSSGGENVGGSTSSSAVGMGEEGPMHKAWNEAIFGTGPHVAHASTPQVQSFVGPPVQPPAQPYASYTNSATGMPALETQPAVSQQLPIQPYQAGPQQVVQTQSVPQPTLASPVPQVYQASGPSPMQPAVQVYQGSVPSQSQVYAAPPLAQPAVQTYQAGVPAQHSLFPALQVSAQTPQALEIGASQQTPAQPIANQGSGYGISDAIKVLQDRLDAMQANAPQDLRQQLQTVDSRRRPFPALSQALAAPIANTQSLTSGTVAKADQVLAAIVAKTLTAGHDAQIVSHSKTREAVNESGETQQLVEAWKAQLVAKVVEAAKEAANVAKMTHGLNSGQVVAAAKAAEDAAKVEKLAEAYETETAAKAASAAENAEKAAKMAKAFKFEKVAKAAKALEAVAEAADVAHLAKAIKTTQASKIESTAEVAAAALRVIRPAMATRLATGQATVLPRAWSALSVNSTMNITAKYKLDTFNCGLFGGAQAPVGSYRYYSLGLDYTFSHRMNRGCLDLPIPVPNSVNKINMLALPGCSVTFFEEPLCQDDGLKVLSAKRQAVWIKSAELSDLGLEPYSFSQIASVLCDCE
jgi:hypothetical protein